MNTRLETLTFKKEEFREWLETCSFGKNGDTFERKYHSLLDADFSRNEEFWRRFVVPLTTRLGGKKSDSFIGFRDGVDPLLQYICGVNYSCFIHFVFAKVALEKWNDTSLDAIYTRLASAFDVFEALIIKFHLLICECRGVKSELIEELSLDKFLEIAKAYYKKEYPKMLEHYVKVGNKVPPIKIPSGPSVFSEFFGADLKRTGYRTVSGEIRAFRNAIVHDVRIGMLNNEKGEILVPKASKISDYREWSKVQEAAKSPELVARDFCEVKAQCSGDIQRSLEAVNSLYETVLKKLDEEIYTPARIRLRELFGIQFQESAPALPAVVQQSDGESSSSFYIGTDSISISQSGVSFIPPEFREHPE
jgi:hypothetical protein